MAFADRVGEGHIEYRTHYKWALILVTVATLVLAGRLFQVQVLHGERYEGLAQISHVVRERIPAIRGVIRDRNGEVLAMDVEISDLMMVPRSVKDPESETSKLVSLGILTEEEASELKRRIETLKTGPKGFQRLVAKRNLTGPVCPYDQERLVYDSATNRLFCPKCGRTFVDQRAVLLAHLYELPGFSIRTRPMRHYPARKMTAHVVGYVNEVNAEDIARSGGELQEGDLIGRTGIEAFLDSVLRGKTGEEVFVRMATGEKMDPSSLPPPFNEFVSTPPVRGQDVWLTIDIGLQKAAMEAMAPHKSGAVVVMDINNGEVLVLYSHPSFDPEPPVFGADKGGREENPLLSPWLNKAVIPYPPGSVFKPFTAIAALMEGAIDEKSEKECFGFIEYRGRRFRCHKRSGHGKITLVEALAASCDVFFYELGDSLGLDTIAHYGRDYFGLGEKTGIELPERRGVIPTRRWYGRLGRPPYQPGFALNAAVGQGDVKVTPLALARAYAALVNGGRLLRPTLVKAIGEKDREDEKRGEVVRVLDLPERYVRTVMKGLYNAVNSEDGTAYGVRLPELPFAGKTGTAQAAETRPGAEGEIAAWLKGDHAWFAAVAPAERPRIVVVVLVEHGGFGGEVAAPVARKVIEAYYREHADEFADLWRGFEDEPLLEVIEVSPKAGDNP